MNLIAAAPGPAPAAKCITLSDFKLVSNEVGIDLWPCSGSLRRSWTVIFRSCSFDGAVLSV